MTRGATPVETILIDEAMKIERAIALPATAYVSKAELREGFDALPVKPFVGAMDGFDMSQQPQRPRGRRLGRLDLRLQGLVLRNGALPEKSFHVL